MKNYLNTTNRNVAWFKGAYDRGELDMKPPFQRNPVWVTRQKSFLIDTILNGYPIPEIYMQETVDEKGKAKYIIVDGQQRTRAVLDFLEGKYCIDSKESPDLADLYFEDLSAEQKKVFFQYNFVIRVLPDIPDTELRAIFQRLNKNVVSLNKQELRQATYWGSFIKTMNLISDKEYWGKIDVFTPNDIRRMLDVEYISELAIFALHGFQNKKDNLDKFYELYEEEFGREKEIVEVFDIVNGELLKILPEISNTRWSKKADYYTLFGLFAKQVASLPLAKESRQEVREKLLEFAGEIDYFVKTDKGDAEVEYNEATKEYGRGIRATTDIGSRKVRENGLSLKLGNVWN
ncbi:DUF262 domain-containing protein [Owenweeksia hongkongensis]|uniref:GmrSD restriction endonucleases N-terminal domain-containing protein n=1 Tax=Owenweeksia hongkongensis (strain DSM 17368 / CIP 108786 / JCM 12287 / NRRL B-23963 / UST20020801) TaxID=926562 RepID=G8R7Q5_OWEHD|nr:DUF262 domain-containing protein [Owenweeksia hongkongensis]AEV33436.1 Protein of unknown function DUF262 [Owenweeksia hongkongensis DSM 17368]